jgi:hypothetical protein
MKIKPGFELRDLCGEQIIVAEGEQNIDFSSIISMNETAAYLWRSMKGQTFTEVDMVSALQREYDVDAATAEADCKTLAQKWIQAGIVEA